MKRVELLEALYLQGKKMRELQVYYFSLRKGGGRYSSPEAKKVLAQSKLEELQFDKMVKDLDEWYGPPTPEGGAEDESIQIEIPEGWFELDKDEFPESGFYLHVIANDGKTYKTVFFEGYFDYEKLGWPDKLNVIAWTYSDTTNEGDDDIRI
jgi:hypothetical protein